MPLWEALGPESRGSAPVGLLSVLALRGSQHFLGLAPLRALWKVQILPHLAVEACSFRYREPPHGLGWGEGPLGGASGGIFPKLTSISQVHATALQTSSFPNQALSSSAGKGNYWTLDPNCEKMFDNGNFRRKRKRRGEASAAAPSGARSPEGAKALERDPLGAASPNLQASPSPPAPQAAACFSSFASAMGALAGGLGAFPGGLAGDFSFGRPTTVAAHGAQSPGPAPSFSSGHQTAASGFRVGHFVYSREGTEV